MTQTTTDFFVSSRPWTTQSPVINGGAEDVTAALNGLYLEHPTASLSMLARTVVAMTAGSIASAAAFITEAGYVRLTGGANFTIDWTGATVLRDLLGFTANLSGAAAYTAPNRSPLLWIPGKIVTFERSPRGTRGEPKLDISATIGTGGNMTTRQEGSATQTQRFSVRHIPKAKFWASQTAVAGEYRHFWESELTPLRRFILLMNVTVGTSTTASAGYSLSTHVGPYYYDLSDQSTHRFAFSRDTGFERVEAYYPVAVPAVVTSEYS